MENLSNRFASRTKSLITFSRNGLRIPEKVVEVQVDGTPVITHEEKIRTSDQPEPISKSCICVVSTAVCCPLSVSSMMGMSLLSCRETERYN